MPLFADAAARAGAVAIRAGGAQDIRDIRRQVDLPLIGLVKRVYEPFEPFITPTLTEVGEVVDAGADIVAVDLTDRPRPDGRDVETWILRIREAYPDVVLMADISTDDEGVLAAHCGCDLVATTLCGYTATTVGTPLPNLDLVRRLVSSIDVPVVAEGGVHEPHQARAALEAVAHCVVVGGAITRPQEIAQRFVDALA